MKTIEDFVPLLGRPVRDSDASALEQIGRSWGIALPADYLEIAGAYGDSVISDFIFFCGARTVETYAAQMGSLLEQSRTVPHLVLPSPGGALVWGNTIEGDQLFLVPHPNGGWTVSAFRRNWHDFYDSDLGFSDWFHLALTGEIGTDWLPEWAPLPHPVKLARDGS
jgi:hypothetical protein